MSIPVAFVAAAVLSYRKFGTSTRTPVQARDVILVTIDTLRADSLGFAGNTRVKTPFLDSLAARGAVFRNAHAHNVITLPSHVNILTGLYPFQHSVRENSGFILDAKVPTLATMLKGAGYATAAFVGAFPLDRRFGLAHDFDTYDDNYGKGQATVDFVIQERRASAVLDAATAWWRANEGKKRFVWIHLYDPHAPYTPPEPFATEYRDREYLGEIAYVDSELQSKLAPLLAADDGALVVVTGDHGEALGDHGELTHGLFAYESTLKIPLVVAGAGVAHRSEDGYVRHVDIAPTILDRLGLPIPDSWEGQSLLAPTRTRFTFHQTYFLPNRFAVLYRRDEALFKFIATPQYGKEELYDLTRDGGEVHNLVDEQKDLSALLREQVTAYRRDQP